VRAIHPVADVRALRALMVELKDLKPDVVHLHSSKAGFLGRVACQLLGFKAVVYTPGGVALLRQDISALQRNAFGALEALGARFTGTVVACGKSEALALQAYGVRARVIANGTLPGPTPPEKRASNGSLTILAMGRATEQKNPAQFGRIAKQMAHSPGFRFVWVGDGALTQGLYEGGVEVTGWLPPAAVRQRLAEADVYMSTSVWEGLSLAVLEGMGAGLPLVLSACAGNVDVVQEGVNGFLFTTDAQAIAHLEHLAADEALRHRMGTESRRLLIAEHDVHSVAAQYSALYGELIGKH
jgi:glycosyltransferase involved in cell wall biosynthesis